MSKPLFSKISYINLYARKSSDLIRFYRDKIGVPVLPEQSEIGDWYGFATEGVTLAIEPIKNKDNYPFVTENHNQVLIQFQADSPEELEQMNQHLEKQGITLLRRSELMSYGIVTNFLDSEENLLEILCAK